MALSIVKSNKKFENQLTKLSQTATLGDIFSYTPTNQINSIELLFPMKYSIKNLTINSVLNIFFPMNIPDFINSKTRIFYSAGISYAFNL
jgi:hypothetical protein